MEDQRGRTAVVVEEREDPANYCMREKIISMLDNIGERQLATLYHFACHLIRK